MRAALGEILYGYGYWPDLVSRIPQVNISDCQSLVDLVAKEGSLPKERRVALDITELREGVENNEGEHLIWTSTDRMIADPMTKHITNQSFLEEIFKRGKIDFDYILAAVPPPDAGPEEKQ